MSIVVGHDGRAEGRDAIALAALLGLALGEPLVVASVYHPPEAVLGQTRAELRAAAVRTASEGAAALPEGVEASAVAVAARSAARGLYELVEKDRPAAVVVGSTHRGPVGRVLAGNVASQLLTASPCPVAVAPRGFAARERGGLASIGVGFDDSAESWNAVQRAAGIGIEAGASLRVIHALQPVAAPPLAPAESERLTGELRASRELALNRAVASVSKQLDAEGRMVVGNPVEVLEHEAHQELDLLVLGSRGYGPLRRVLLGSVSAELVGLAPCPVLVVPRSVEFDPTAGGMAARDEAVATSGA